MRVAPIIRFVIKKSDNRLALMKIDEAKLTGGL